MRIFSNKLKFNQGWTINTTTAGDLQKVIYAFSKFFVCGSKIGASSDLSTWNYYIDSQNRAFTGFAYGSDKLLSICNTGSATAILKNTTGSYDAWSSATLLNINSIYTKMAYDTNTSKFIIAGKNSNQYASVRASSDLLLWSEIHDHSTSSQYNDVIYADNKVLAVGKQGSSGIVCATQYPSSYYTWTTSQISQSELLSVTYGNKFVISGKNGYLFDGKPGDGWRTNQINTSDITGICYNSGIYYACGKNGFVASSKDLSSWVGYSLGDYTWNDITVADNKLVVVGNSGKIAYKKI